MFQHVRLSIRGGFCNLGTRDKISKKGPKNRTICDMSCVQYAVQKGAYSKEPRNSGMAGGKVKNLRVMGTHKKQNKSLPIMPAFIAPLSGVPIYRY